MLQKHGKTWWTGMFLAYKSVNSQSFFRCFCRSNKLHIVLDGAHFCDIAWTALFVATISADCALVVGFDRNDIGSGSGAIQQCSWFLHNSEFAVAWPSSAYLVNNQIQPPIETYMFMYLPTMWLQLLLIRICTGILIWQNNQTDIVVMYYQVN